MSRINMVIILGLMFALSLNLPLAAQAQLDIDDTHFFFGWIPNVCKVSHSYVMRSTGKDSLKILSVKPGCGCTKAPIEKEIVAPGDSTAVELIFTSAKEYYGSVQKTATVTCNDDARGTFQLRFKCLINTQPDTVKPAQLTPWMIDYTTADKAKENTVVVKNVSDKPLTLSLVSNPIKFLAITLPTGPIAPGKSGTIKVKILPTVNVTEFEKSFTFATGPETDAPRYTVPVTFNRPAESTEHSH